MNRIIACARPRAFAPRVGLRTLYSIELGTDEDPETAMAYITDRMRAEGYFKRMEMNRRHWTKAELKVIKIERYNFYNTKKKVKRLVDWANFKVRQSPSHECTRLCVLDLIVQYIALLEQAEFGIKRTL